MDPELSQETVESVETEAPAVEQETASTGQDAIQGQAEGTPTQEETFLSDAELLAKIQQDPQLKHFYGKMQGAYGKSREELKRGREAAAQVTQFYQDPNYRRQILQQFAHELGMQAPAGEPKGQPTAQGHPMLADLETRIKSELSPELQWMAPQLAKAQLAVLTPLLKQQEDAKKRDLTAAFDEATQQMSEKYPGWEAHEQEMDTVLGWLQSGDMTHKKYGNRVEALYKLTQLLNGNNGHAVAEYGRRVATAAKSRTVTGRVGAPATPNYTEQVRKARTSSEAVQAAAKAAEEMLAAQGVTFA